MATELQLDMHVQPDDTTCGPTCLHAVYRYYGDPVSIDTVIEETPKLSDGGTLGVYLGCDALSRGYAAKLYTYNLNVFDPTWFQKAATDMRDSLRAQLKRKTSKKLREASQAYIEYLDHGGRLKFTDLTASLLRRYLSKGVPILTGLNATYLYGSSRERVEGDEVIYDDVGGEPSGHFVVVHGYNKANRMVSIADPYPAHPLSESQSYHVKLERLICSIMLGIVTYDANLLIIEPKKTSTGVD